MDNPFKKILHNEELPDVLREKVLNDVAMIKLSIDVADLFVVKYPNAIADLLNGGGSRSSNNIDKEDKKEND
ncbi:hypothetical protein SAMN04489761_1389 [Tenacibaculum sp. MAR_2009_124]|uniref:hypothetical protein n=1 Tax=Tenacibaculum sp. MAR_2009_124 TaxID=1250059 RepID=UPI000899ECD6|nr:hypothetical protein [Tenacibaculum sp. MAR_2009_124]SEB66950.1 hypothetical protein SAMN04489761_1389 [Tenacibaculum sp. MAR_2009_124]